MRRELASERLLASPFASYSPETLSELAIVRAAAESQQRYGPACITQYVISKCESVSDLLEVNVLLKEAGLSDRVERRVMDFAQAAAAVEAADLVIMNRVICCYPEMPRLTAAASDHARRLLVLSYPRRSWWTVAGLAIANWMLWLTRREFHIFVHPPAQILATAEGRGLSTELNVRGWLWTVAALRRTA